jgi:hypothetical protein
MSVRCRLSRARRTWPRRTSTSADVTQMYGPAVRCKWFRRAGGERSCINVSGLRLECVMLRAIMDISARATSLTDRPQRAIWVTSVRTRREDRTSISSHPLADLGWKLLIGLRHRLLLISRSSFVRANRRSFVPARRTSIASRAGVVKAGRRAWLAARAGVARLRLDRAEHGARIKRVGRLHHRSSSARRRVPWPAPPRRSGQACWRARSRARCGATAFWRLRSRI